MANFKKLLYLIAIVLVSCSQEQANTIHFREHQETTSDYELAYETGNWEHPDYGKAFESYGNQRIVIHVDKPSKENVQVIIPWRRSDNRPSEKDIIIVDATTASVVDNRHILEINNEYGHLIFQPNKKSSLYYIYFLPHTSTGSYYPKLTYKKPTVTLDSSWLSEVR